MKAKILVTGGSGFIGTNLIDFYESQGSQILNIDITPPRKIDQNPYWKEADIRDLTCLRELVSQFQPHFVLHMAARADLTGKSIDDYSTNTKGVENIIKVCNEVSGIKKVIFASTMLVCKVGYIPTDENDYCPPNYYGKSKMIGEKLVKEASAKLKYSWVIIRPTSIWGPWFGPTYRRFFEMIIKKRYFNFSGKMSTKIYGYIGNSIYQIDELLNQKSPNGKTFYIGDYSPVNIKEWAVEISNELNQKLITVPRPIVWMAAKIGDFLIFFNLNFPLSSFRLKNMTTDNIIPLDETKKIAPKTIFTRSEANKITLRWMKDHYLNKLL